MITLRGYYAIVDVPRDEPGGSSTGYQQAQAIARAIARSAQLLSAGPCMLQIRAKWASAADLATLARAVLPAARTAGIPLCVNDRLDVALAVGAQAVHLGQDDLSLAEARSVAAGRLAIGISTHNPEQARAAIAGGADYIGYGPIFSTATKANPDETVGIAGLRQIVEIAAGLIPATKATDHRRVPVPVVAIGGVALDTIADVARTGASAAALIGAVDRALDPVAAGRAVNAAFAAI